MAARLSVSELMAAPCWPGVRLAWKEASRCGKSLYWLVPRSAMLSGSHTRAVSPNKGFQHAPDSHPVPFGQAPTANSPMCLDTDSSIAGMSPAAKAAVWSLMLPQAGGRARRVAHRVRSARQRARRAPVEELMPPRRRA